MGYVFGNTDAAAQRLKVLAEVFADSSRFFLRDTVPEKQHLALDLGCGPGYSSHLLMETLRCDQVVGLDNSARFITQAHNTGTGRVSFRLHDITTVPFPVGPSDLLYCRLLLTHLKEPDAAVGVLATQLRPEGLLLIEELERIDTKDPVFTAYLEIVQAMLESQANNLYVGPVLSGLQDTALLKRRTSQVRRLQVTRENAAKMFFLNMQTWKQHPFIQANYSSDLIRELGGDLDAITTRPSTEIKIEWEIRQLVFQRV